MFRITKDDIKKLIVGGLVAGMPTGLYTVFTTKANAKKIEMLEREYVRTRELDIIVKQIDKNNSKYSEKLDTLGDKVDKVIWYIMECNNDVDGGGT